MKRIALFLCIFVIAAMCLIPLFIPPKAYDSPESFCEKCGYKTYYIINGNDSAFIVFKESESKFGNAFLKKTDHGFVSVGYHVKREEFFDPYSGTMYKSKEGDHYLMVLFSTEKGQTITDSLGSSFEYIPFLVLPGEETPQSILAVAYIGRNSDDYYSNEYWYKIE